MRSWLAFGVVVAFGLLVAVLPTPQRATAASGFTDVPGGAYYAGAVDWLVDQGITQGTSPTTFSPDDPVTRGQMAAFLWRFGSQYSGVDHGFVDVPGGVYYDTAVGWLLLHAITMGTTPTTFSPDQAVTRAQMAVFLWRYAGRPTPAAPATFTDVPSGTWFTDAVGWLVESGITQGTSPTTYSPDATVTRAQTATFLWRFAGEPLPGDPGVNRNPKLYDCGLQTTIPTPECETLVAIKTANPDAGLYLTDWIIEPDPATWGGIIITTGTVTQLDLRSAGLTILPPEIENVTNLTRLALYDNALTTLPPEIGNLTKLQYLWLYDNALTTLPPEIGNLTNLIWLYLSGNQLTGAIPPALTNLTKLTGLTLAFNQLSGPIPPALGNLTKLIYLDLRSNQLVGAIPSQLGNLTDLAYLYFSSNTLTGAIPSALGSLTKLQYVWLFDNRLSGAIPVALGGLPELTDLELNSNQLSGPVPPGLASLPNLANLSLFGQAGCLTAVDTGFATWLAGFDPQWNDGCLPP